jgi:hypothetical protein
MENQIAVKDREIDNANAKLNVHRRELQSLQKRTVMSEADRIAQLQEKTQTVQNTNKELARELKALKNK